MTHRHLQPGDIITSGFSAAPVLEFILNYDDENSLMLPIMVLGHSHGKIMLMSYTGKIRVEKSYIVHYWLNTMEVVVN